MERNENILDSGEIYKKPEEETPQYLPELELEPNKVESVDWKPLKFGGEPFKTYDLVFKNGNTINFEATKISYLYGAILIAIGLLFLLLGLAGRFFYGPTGNVLIYLFGGLGLLFAIGGGLMIDFFSIPTIFNKDLGLYWKGRRPILSYLFSRNNAFSVNLNDIKAVQLLSEYVTTKNQNFFSYEINMVLTNNERLNIVDHGDSKAALKDATDLAKFLGVPLLNGLERKQ